MSPLHRCGDSGRLCLSNAAIAEHLVVAERTVEAHIGSLLSKLGLEERSDTHRRVLAVLAFLRG